MTFKTPTRSSDPFLFFSQKEKDHIVAAVREAEKHCSAEIRVHLERTAREDVLTHAQEVFEKSGMTKTAHHNGVLIFLGVRSNRFAVIGDKGIHDKMEPGFWDAVSAEMVRHFKKDHFAVGIAAAVKTIGERLKTHFPHQRNDVNELPDEISYSL